MIYVILLVLIGLMCMEGVAEAYYFHFKYSSRAVYRGVDEHKFFMLYRCMILGLAACTVLPWNFLAALPLLFSFFHNGAYYTMRNKLKPNIYPKKWWDESNTTTAKFSFSPITRTLFAVAGVVLIFVFG